MSVAIFVGMAIFAIAAVPSINGQVSCDGRPDGAYGIGCKSYTSCKGGVGTTVECSRDMAFNYLTSKCESMDTVPAPCGTQANDCDTKPDGLYAYKDLNCYWFYTCQDGSFKGANPCNFPVDSGVLVFDEKNQVCNWKAAVAKPCGTLEG